MPYYQNMNMSKYCFYSNCVSWPQKEVQALIACIDNNLEISRNAFLKHVDRNQLLDLERDLGYDSHHKIGLTMAGDYHVSYHRSKLNGKRVYYFRHSAIEYVFTR